MAHIDMASIEAKIHDWESSDKGRKKKKQIINQHISKQVDKTEGGSQLPTRRVINKHARKLIEAVKKAAKSHDLPSSVMAHFDSLKIVRSSVMPDGSFVVEIAFTDDLTRQSLQPENYDGAKNIIAIFNNGYPRDSSRSEAISHVSGWWHDRNVNALGFRPAMHFMQTAVADYNASFGNKEGFHAEIGEIYQT